MKIYALFCTLENRYIYKLTNDGKIRWVAICSAANFVANDDTKLLCYEIDYDSWIYPKYIVFKEEHLQGPLVEL